MSRPGGRGPGFRLSSGAVLTVVDKKAKQRQLYQIAELGKPSDAPTRAPNFMRLLVAPDQPRIEGEGLDFRDEIMSQIYDAGDPVPKRRLQFLIETTDQGAVREVLGVTRWRFENWRRIGTLTFDSAVASYNGDFVEAPDTRRLDRGGNVCRARVDRKGAPNGVG